MSKSYLTHINLNKNELQNAVIQPLASAPSSPAEGQIYYDTVDDTVYVRANGAWLDLGTSGTGSVATVVAGNNIDVDSTDPANPVVSVETLVLADISDITATSTELNYVDGVTSSIQTQLGTKAPTASPTFTGTVTLSTGLTGVIRADSGVVSTDSDVTDLVSAASDTAAGKVELATTAETTTGTDATRAVTPDGLHDMTSVAGAAWVLDEDNMASNSDTKLPTQQSVKAYVDSAVVGLFDLKGSTDTSSNPNYPAASKGDAYVVSVAGKVGGASGVSVDVGDVYVATADNAGGTQASVGASWTILEHNLVGALLSANNLSDVASAATAFGNIKQAASDTATGVVELATQAETEAKSDTARAVVPADLANFPQRKTFTIGDNSATQIDVTHSLGTKEVITQVRQASDDAVVECDITNFSTSVVRLNFAVAPATNALKVVVLG